MRAFWNAATALDSNALDLTEDKRFPFCTPEQLDALVTKAGFRSVETSSIEAPTVFKDFEDLWQPFTLGTGPAPGYCMSLDPELRQRLKDRLRMSLPHREDGSIPLKVRAWAVKAAAP